MQRVCFERHFDGILMTSVNFDGNCLTFDMIGIAASYCMSYRISELEDNCSATVLEGMTPKNCIEVLASRIAHLSLNVIVQVIEGKWFRALSFTLF